MRRCDNELVRQLVQMPDIHVIMHSETGRDGTSFIIVTMGFAKYGRGITRKFSIDDIDVFGFELLLGQMYRDLKGDENVEEE